MEKKPISQKQLEANRKNALLAGRPVATPTLVKQLFKKALAERINEDLESWVTPIEDLAKGHFVEVRTAEGEVKVYKKSPDAKAWQVVMDRVFGKPEQSVDLTSKGKQLGDLTETPQMVELRQKYEAELRNSLIEPK
jgi:hypothetical protein